MVRVWCVLILVWAGSAARAELQSLFPRGEGQNDTVTRASLFAPDIEQGFFAPLPDRVAPSETVTFSTSANGTGREPVDQLLSLIARAEAGSAGYDAVQYGARIITPRPPTQMTLGEIYQWIDDTPGQPHAIGRYQFIPPTLRRVAQVRGFGPETPFTPGVQDALALVLLNDAGFERFQAGTLERRRFMYNLARIWAGLPLPNGNSYYDGYAGNKATMSWATFEGGMVRVKFKLCFASAPKTKVKSVGNN